MKKLSCILMATILILQLGTYAVGARVPENESPNLVVNGDFSDGKNGWSLRDSNSVAAFEVAKGMGEDGSDCLYVSKSDRSGDVTQAIPSLVNAKAGESYLISAKIRLATEGATATAQWGYTEGGGYWLGNSNGAHETVTDTATITDKWTKVSVVFTLSKDYLYVPNYFLVASNSGDKGGYYLDDVILRRVDTDYVANPNFDYGTAGWTHDGADAIAAYKDGNEACIKVTNGTNKDRVDLRQMSGAAFKKAEVGDVYGVIAKVKVASTTSETTKKARLLLGGWSWLGDREIPVTANEWTLLSATYVVTDATNVESALGLWVALYDGANATTEFLVDDVAVFKVEDEKFNSDFEYGTAGWTHDGAAEFIAYKDGNEACAKVTSGTNKDRVDLRQPTGELLKSAKIGDKYCVTAKVKVASSDATATKAGLCLGGWAWVVQNVPVTADEWTQLSATYEVTNATNIAGALGLWVALNDTANATTEFLVDDVAVFKIEDELFNSGFDYGTAGWTHDGATEITAYKDGSEACIKVTNGTDKERVDLRQPSGDVLKSAKVGDKYCVNAKVKVASTNSTFTTARLCLGGWSWLGEQNVPVTTDGWTQLSATYEVSEGVNIAGVQGLWVALYDNGSAITEFLLDDVFVLKIEDESFNSGFDYGTAGWTHDGATEITAYKDGSEACIKVTSGTNRDRVDLRQLSYDMLKSSKVGDKYCVTAKVKVASTNSASTTARLCLGGWSWLGEQNVPVTSNEWTQLRSIYEVPEGINIAGAQGLWVVLYDNANTNTEFLIDDVSVVKVEKGVLVNAGFEDDLFGWGKNGVSNTTYTILDDGAPEGNKYLKIQCGAYEGELQGKDTPDVKQNYDFVSGKTYMISVKYKSDNASDENPVYPEFFCNGTWRGGSVVTDNEWTEITTVFTAQQPTGANGRTVLLRQRETQAAYNAAPGYTYYLDDFSVREVNAEDLLPKVTFNGSAKETGEINADVTFYNKENAQRTSDFVFIALYNGDGKLVKFEPINTDVFRNSVAKVSIPLTVETADENAYAKVLVWNKDLKPYIIPVDINE